jgi:hypothetical protein
MGVRQKYTEVKKYDIDDFFIENLQEIEFPLSVRIAEFIEENLKYIPSSNLVSYVVGGLVMYNHKPVAFALELVRTLGDNPILSDIELISMDEYLDLMNLNLYIKSDEYCKDQRLKRNSERPFRSRSIK